MTVTLGYADTKRELGITYRQLDHWTRLGLLKPMHAGGSGISREWTHAELDVARLMGRLVGAGMKPGLAEQLARSSRVRVAPGIRLELGPALSDACDRGDCEGCFPGEPSDCGCACHEERTT